MTTHPLPRLTRTWLLAALLPVLAACGGEPQEAGQTPPERDLRAEALAAEAEQKARREREAAELDRLIARMQPVYAELETLRQSTKKLHDRLTRRLRRQTIPPEHGAEITRIMTEVNYHLRTPRQLGAFKGVEEIQAELGRAQQAATQLAQVDAWVPEQR